MEEKAFGGIMILTLLFLHSCTINLHSAAAFPDLSVSSGDSVVSVKHNRKLLDMREVNDYDSTGPNRSHDPPTTLVPTPAPTPAPTPSIADDNAKPGPNTRHGHSPPTA